MYTAIIIFTRALYATTAVALSVTLGGHLPAWLVVTAALIPAALGEGVFNAHWASQRARRQACEAFARDVFYVNTRVD